MQRWPRLRRSLYLDTCGAQRDCVLSQEHIGVPHAMIYRKKLTWFECRLPKIMILESKWKHWVILLENSPSHLMDELLIYRWKIFRYAEVPNSSSADTKTVASVMCIQRTPSSIAITSLLTNHLICLYDVPNKGLAVYPGKFYPGVTPYRRVHFHLKECAKSKQRPQNILHLKILTYA